MTSAPNRSTAWVERFFLFSNLQFYQMFLSLPAAAT